MMIASVTGDLSQQLGRSPTPREIAERLDIGIEEVLEGMESANAYSTLSIDAGGTGDEGLGSVLATMGGTDDALDHVELRESIRPLIDRLPPREKQILLLRFFRQMTQSQIAEEVGISQMHVSRLLTRTLAELRESIS
jgi:RNA polymerase sigma-B factor